MLQRDINEAKFTCSVIWTIAPLRRYGLMAHCHLSVKNGKDAKNVQQGVSFPLQYCDLCSKLCHSASLLVAFGQRLPVEFHDPEEVLLLLLVLHGSAKPLHEGDPSFGRVVYDTNPGHPNPGTLTLVGMAPTWRTAYRSEESA